MNPESIVAAALITQVSVLAIVFIGTLFVRIFEEPGYLPADQPRTNSILVFTLGNAIVSLLCLLFSDAFSRVWRPIMKEIPFHGIEWQQAILGVWILDILLLAILVDFTGGSHSSPFTSLFFVFPTIALFLHESGWRLVLYTGLVALLFSVSFRKPAEPDPSTMFSYWFVSVASFILTTAIGFVTRA